MIRRMYQRLTTSTTKGLIVMGAMLGVGVLPCPECGTPMIFHFWPIAGLVLTAQAIKKHYREKGQVISEIAPTEPRPPASAMDNGE